MEKIYENIADNITLVATIAIGILTITIGFVEKIKEFNNPQRLLLLLRILWVCLAINVFACVYSAIKLNPDYERYIIAKAKAEKVETYKDTILKYIKTYAPTRYPEEAWAELMNHVTPEVKLENTRCSNIVIVLSFTVSILLIITIAFVTSISLKEGKLG